MRRFLSGVAAFACLVAFALPVSAAETITGKVVDMNCYNKDKVNNAGLDHKMPKDTKDCAIACAKAGQPLALLTKDGKVYEIAGGLASNKNAKLIAHVGQTVEITGDTMSMPQNKMMITAGDLKVVSE